MEESRKSETSSHPEVHGHRWGARPGAGQLGPMVGPTTGCQIGADMTEYPHTPRLLAQASSHLGRAYRPPGRSRGGSRVRPVGRGTAPSVAPWPQPDTPGRDKRQQLNQGMAPHPGDWVIAEQDTCTTWMQICMHAGQQQRTHVSTMHCNTFMCVFMHVPSAHRTCM